MITLLAAHPLPCILVVFLLALGLIWLDAWLESRR